MCAEKVPLRHGLKTPIYGTLVQKNTKMHVLMQIARTPPLHRLEPKRNRCETFRIESASWRPT
ncbi:hypothetical protein G647_06840 [Cladophialophora carrionii CBS 160.54]|uniref:Uncharacterized protein n=1 Tax=Cladophialophora carrionii CBS 160.54 TaxID=1279043 RepID=V9D760_9EURO|nr:uncharacterized protein G647_06840 [Cladophialophora carrionii CBS 160.54]ETI22764.1 hypothetical protein G647_06840 [Cladophialophora carrionii CBS 160.54]